MDIFLHRLMSSDRYNVTVAYHTPIEVTCH